MDEFKPEDDLRPDSSDRRPTRSRKQVAVPRFAVSRQHIMMGIGILVLLLLIIGIGSALKAPTKHEAAHEGAARDISLSGSSSLTTNNGGMPGGNTDTHDNNGEATSQPQNVSIPPIAGTPTEAKPQPQQGGAQQRVDLPGNMADALSSQQKQFDAATQGMIGAASTLPTAPATLMNGAAARETTRPVQGSAPQQHKLPAKTAAHNPSATQQKAPTTMYTPPSTTSSAKTASSIAKAGAVSGRALQSAPASHYTLQLSSASRADTLNAYAKEQKLQHYRVYATKRDGKPWYVLVSGNYASSAEAKRAVASLPADVQAKKPWVRPVRQVQQDLKK